jgi:hypothetical protein
MNGLLQRLLPKVALGLLGTSLLLFGATRDAAATILGFDDIGATNSILFPDGYGGLNWGIPGESPPWFDKTNSAFTDGVVSGEYAAIFGTSTHTVTNPGGTFDFVGAYFTGGWFDKTAPVMGYLDDVEIYSTTVFADNGVQNWYAFNWTGIDKLVFPVIDDGGTPGNNDDYVVDNFTIENVSVVPEPSTFALGILGLLSLGMIGRRRRRR